MARKRLRIAVRKFEPFERAIEKQVAAFAETTAGNDLSLEYESLDLNPLRETLFENGGLRDGTWDVAFLNTDWIAEAIESESVVNIRPLMEQHPVEGYPGGWAPALRRLQDDGERIWGLPYHDGPQCLIYRRDLLENEQEQSAFRGRFGRELVVPQTWEQFTDVARFFTRPDEGLFGTIFAAFPDAHNTVYDYCVQLWSRGGQLADLDGRPLLDTDEGAAALDFYRAALSDRTMTPAGLMDVDSVQSGEMFASGSVAMMANWFGFAAMLEQPGHPLKGKIGIAPLPCGAGGRPVALNVYWILAVAAGSTKIEEAYSFLRFVATPAMDKLTALQGATACRLSTWQDPDVNARVPFYRQLNELHSEARELPASSTFPRFAHILDSAIQRAIRTGDPTRQILADAQAEADTALVRL